MDTQPTPAQLPSQLVTQVHFHITTTVGQRKPQTRTQSIRFSFALCSMPTDAESRHVTVAAMVSGFRPPFAICPEIQVTTYI